MIGKNEAIHLMNSWSAAQVPFLFIVDIGMKAIRLYRLDQPLPENIQYDFQGSRNTDSTPLKLSGMKFRKFPVPFREYRHAFEAVQHEIHAGNTFLTNLTFPTPIETNLTFGEIFAASQAKYKLLVDPEFVCFSPETFVTIRGNTISTFPMKGTIRVSSQAADHILLSDTKEIAEHNTIVDLLRNDISRVATGVKVNRFRYIDRIRTHEGELLQVSSEISGELPHDYASRLGDIIFAMLPAGSVTGAPKEKTMDIIRKVEATDRGYYTGVCGIFDGFHLDSAVMIRFIEMHEGSMRFRSGGGITFMSDAKSEYNELIDKVYVPVNGNH